MRLIKYVFLLSVLIGCCRCNLFEESGFPGKVFFPKEGGTKTLTGDWHLYTCWIDDVGFNSHIFIDDNSYKYTYDWLKVVIEPKPTKHLTLTVKPNTTNKPRTLRLMISDGSPQSEDEIYIYQE